MRVGGLSFSWTPPFILGSQGDWRMLPLRNPGEPPPVDSTNGLVSCKAVFYVGSSTCMKIISWGGGGV